MISVILYGRNDTHGYNLHKRAAISLNTMAHVLTDPDDEIVFVDYNTPDDFPSFPEAIADTLTEHAKRLLRIFRVRPAQHQRFREKTELVALEPIARNVGVRRSNPKNRWLLSTNTDMIFVPRQRASLSETVADLPDAYYHLPRFELPESLWEALDRYEPGDVIAQIAHFGEALHLNEISCIQYPETRYDAPGDFQLMLRSDVLRVHGFDEAMLLGWHVDSNIAKRLALVGRQRGELVESVFGYHCDHYRQLTALHSQHGQRNDVQAFFEDVVDPWLTEQADTWGLAGEDVEENTVDSTTRSYVSAVQSTIPFPLAQATLFEWTGKEEEEYDYSVDHVLPYLESSIASYSRDSVLGWYGVEKALLWRFAAAWTTMGFQKPLQVFEDGRWLGPTLPPDCAWTDTASLESNPAVYVFDFGRTAHENGSTQERARRRAAVLAGFRDMVEAEQRRLETVGELPKRFIGVNTIVTHDVAQAFEGRIEMSFIPNATHIKEGIVIQAPRAFSRSSDMECMDLLLFGTAAIVGPPPNQPFGRAIHARPGIRGPLAYGPYIALSPGHYEAIFEFFSERPKDGKGFDVDISTDQGRRILARGTVKPHAGLRAYEATLERKPGPVTFILPFDVEPSREENAIEFRVFSPGTINFCLVRLRVRRIAER